MKREARTVLSSSGITVGQDFNSLSIGQIAAISTEAEATYQRKHGKRMPEDSTTYIRKRYDLLQLRAQS